MAVGDAPAPTGSVPDVAAPSVWVGRRAVWGLWLLSVVVVGFESWRPAWSIDEAASVMVVRRSAGEVWRAAGVDAAIGPYYLALKVWTLASDHALWVRLPSVLAVATAVVALFVLVAETVDRRAAWFSALTLLAFPSASRYGQEARPYAFALLAAVLTVLCWWRYLHRGRRRDAVGAGAALVVAGLAHAYALLMAPVLAMAALAFPAARRREVLTRTLVPLGVALLAMTPFLLLVSRNAKGSPDPRPISVTNLGRTAIEIVVSNSRPFLSPAVTATALTLGVVVIALAAAGIVVSWRRGGDGRVVAVLVATWAVLPPAVMVLGQALAHKPGLVSRYWFVSAPALAWGVGLALAAVAVRRRAVAVGVLVVLALVGIPSQAFIRTPDGHGGQGWHVLPAVLSTPGLSGMPVVLDGWGFRSLVANDPAFPWSRLPLVRDPSPDGLINPQEWSPGSPAFTAMVAANPSIVVFQDRRRSLTRPPTAESFRMSDPVLKVWSTPVVLCSHYGDALGVFSQPGRAPATSGTELARQIEAVAPGHIRCTVP